MLIYVLTKLGPFCVYAQPMADDVTLQRRSIDWRHAQNDPYLGKINMYTHCIYFALTDMAQLVDVFHHEMTFTDPSL